MFSLKFIRLGLTPHQASKFSHFGLVELKALQGADFGDDTGGEDRADPRNGLEGVGDGVKLVSDGGFEPLLMILQAGDVFEGEGQNCVERLLEGVRQVIGILDNLLQFTGIVGWVGEAAFALAVDEFDQVRKVEGRNLFDGDKLLQDRPAGGPENVLERALVGMSVFTGFEVE